MNDDNTTNTTLTDWASPGSTSDDQDKIESGDSKQDEDLSDHTDELQQSTKSHDECESDSTAASGVELGSSTSHKHTDARDVPTYPLPDEYETYGLAVEYADNLIQTVLRDVPSQVDVSADDGGSESESDPDSNSIAKRVMSCASQYDGKYRSNVSLSTHILNVTFTGLSTFAFELAHDDAAEKFEDRDLNVLIAGLLLHDVNKYIANRDGDIDTTANTGEVLDRYLETDDFGLVGTLIEESDRDDVLYLILHTETGENASESLDVDVDPQIRDLARYCRIGDGLCSVIQKDGLEAGSEYLSTQFATYETNPVHCIRTNTIPRPFLQTFIATTTKQAIEGRFCQNGAYGLVIGSTSDHILMLGGELDPSRIERLIYSDVKREITDFAEFRPKTRWNSFEYDTLEEIDISVDRKRQTITDGYVDVLESGTGGFDPIESVSEGFKRLLPELIHGFYVENDYEFESEALESIREQVAENTNPNTFKVYFLAELAKQYNRIENELTQWADGYEDDVSDILRVDTDQSALLSSIEEVFSPTLSEVDLTVPVVGEQCFLCGEHATRDYQKGNAFYGTNAFSKRVPARGTYKQICTKCNLEYSLLEQHVDTHEYISLRNDILAVYISPNRFSPHVVDGEYHPPSTAVSKGLINFGDAQPQTDIFESGTQISLVKLNHPRDSKQQQRLSNVRQMLQYIDATGMQITIGKGFSSISGGDSLFVDTDPCRIQSDVGLARIDTREELTRALELFDILAMGYATGVNNPYTQLDKDSYEELVTLKYDTFEMDGRTEKISQYVHKYHLEEHMKMIQVARSGRDLHGTIYGSKYAKTRTFKITLNAIIDGLSSGMDKDALRELASSEAYNAARNEKYSGHTTNEQASQFVDDLFAYLEEYDNFSMKALTDKQGTLLNLYMFASDQLISDEDDGKKPSGKEDDEQQSLVPGQN